MTEAGFEPVSLTVQSPCSYELLSQQYQESRALRCIPEMDCAQGIEETQLNQMLAH